MVFRAVVSILLLAVEAAAVLLQLPVVQDKVHDMASVLTKNPERLLWWNIKSQGRVRLPSSNSLRNLQPPLTSFHKNFHRLFTTTSSTMASSTAFLDATRSRRTMYKITNESTISDNRIEQLVCHAIANIPSAFNTQSARIVVLLKQEHEKLWDISKEIFQKVIPADKWGYIEGRINGFRAGYGTILFFEDRTPIQEMQSKQPMVADKMPQWSEHSSGMHQYFLWTALEAEGLGCSLQHYNPAIDTRVQAEWKVPVEWDLKCQLVFGKPTAPPNEKIQKPVEERYRVYGK